MWSDQGLLSISKSRLKTKDDTKDETSHTKHTNETVLDTHLGGFNIFLYMMQFLLRLQVIPKVLERQGQSVCSCCVLKTCCLRMRLQDDYEERHPSISLNSLVFMSLYSYWKNKARPLSVLVLHIRTRGQTVTKGNKSDPQIPESDYSRQRTAKCVPTV